MTETEKSPLDKQHTPVIVTGKSYQWMLQLVGKSMLQKYSHKYLFA